MTNKSLLRRIDEGTTDLLSRGLSTLSRTSWNLLKGYARAQAMTTFNLPGYRIGKYLESDMPNRTDAENVGYVAGILQDACIAFAKGLHIGGIEPFAEDYLLGKGISNAFAYVITSAMLPLCENRSKTTSEKDEAQ